MNSFQTTFRRLRLSLLGTGVCALLFYWLLARGAELHTTDPYEVIAGYLHAFPAYVSWPTKPAETNLVPWRIVVVGKDPFDGKLDRICQEHPVAGRAFQIIRVADVQHLPPCDIVYLASQDASEIKSWLDALISTSVLTVSDADDFIKLGGMIQMEKGRTVRFSVNLDRMQAVGLKAGVQMLDVASRIFNHGAFNQKHE